MEELTLLAHGEVERINLPVPLWLTVVLTAVTVAAAFSISRLRKSATVDLPLPRVQRFCDSPITRGALQLAGLVALEIVLIGAWFGPSAVSANAATTWFYVWFWVGLVPITLVAGDIYRWANPLRTTALLLGRLRRSTKDPEWVDRLGFWPAVAALVIFLVLDTVSQEGDWPRVVAGFISAYAVITIAAGAWFGPRWFERYDAFAVYFGLIARVAPIGRRPDGTLVLRNPLPALRSAPVDRGLVAFIVTVMGGATLAGLGHFPFWLRFDLVINPSDGDAVQSIALSSMLLVAVSVAIGAIYAGCTWAIRRFRRASRDPFAPVLIPLMVAFIGTTHLAAALFESQAGYLLVSGGGAIDYRFISTTTFAFVQFSVMIFGSVVAAITAQIIASEAVEPRFQRLSAIPLGALVLAYTLIGILIVAG